MPKNPKGNTKVKGKFLLAVNVTAGNVSNTVIISPGNFPGLLAMSNAFQFYKFRKLKFNIMPPAYPESSFNTTTNGACAVGLILEETKSTSTSIGLASICSLEHSKLIKADQVISGAGISGNTGVVSFDVTKALNSLPVNWYKTQAASAENTEIQQATLVVGVETTPLSTMTFLVHVDFMVEFKDFVDATNIV
jgi:hypothetical protein